MVQFREEGKKKREMAPHLPPTALSSVLMGATFGGDPTEIIPPVPGPAGYVLIFLGLAQMWVAPVWIIRKYIRARVAEEEMAKAVESADKQ